MSNNATLAPARSNNTRQAGSASTDRPATQTRESTQDGQVSLSTITLYLRPKGEGFHERPHSRTFEAGFDCLSSGGAGLASRDTGETIATLNPDGNGLSRPIREFKLSIDPEACAIEFKAGTRLLRIFRDCAVLIGAQACDGFGKHLSTEDLDALANHIDAVISRRRDEAWEARKFKLPSGEVRLAGELSFQYMVLKEAGSRKSAHRSVDFDCTPMPYYQGYIRGLEMAEEFIAYHRKHKEAHIQIARVLEAAIDAANEKFPAEGKSKRGQARGFLMVMETLLRVGMNNINLKWLTHQKEQAAATHEALEKYDQRKKAEFVARMRAAREAKKIRGAA